MAIDVNKLLAEFLDQFNDAQGFPVEPEDRAAQELRLFAAADDAKAVLAGSPVKLPADVLMVLHDAANSAYAHKEFDLHQRIRKVLNNQ